MAEKFWFNRMAEHWSIPERLDLVEHVGRAKLQVVQVGTFGPMFYSLADDPEVNRHWVGMPLVGVRENLACAAELIPQLQEVWRAGCWADEYGMELRKPRTGKGTVRCLGANLDGGSSRNCPLC